MWLSIAIVFIAGVLLSLLVLTGLLKAMSRRLRMPISTGTIVRGLIGCLCLAIAGNVLLYYWIQSTEPYAAAARALQSPEAKRVLGTDEPAKLSWRHGFRLDTGTLLGQKRNGVGRFIFCNDAPVAKCVKITARLQDEKWVATEIAAVE